MAAVNVPSELEKGLNACEAIRCCDIRFRQSITCDRLGEWHEESGRFLCWTHRHAYRPLKFCRTSTVQTYQLSRPQGR